MALLAPDPSQLLSPFMGIVCATCYTHRHVVTPDWLMNYSVPSILIACVTVSGEFRENVQQFLEHMVESFEMQATRLRIEQLQIAFSYLKHRGGRLSNAPYSFHMKPFLLIDFFSRGVWHDCGTALNEATTVMGYQV